MTHEAEYHDNMVTMLELIWGKGYMAPGGPGNVAKLLDGTEPEGKLILDIGCGIGGPALDMVRRHGAQVVGVDLEASLIERARSDARAAGLHEHCMFQRVDPGPLPFPNAGFDIVVSSGAVTQTSDKTALFSEILRVLKPGGYFSCYEWMGTGEEPSEELRYWIELEELTYAFETLEQYGDRLRTAGFTEVSTTDASDWYRREARRECALIEGARSDARAAGLHEHCMFQRVDPGPLPFPNAGFDIVVSSGAVTQTSDKTALFSEVLRVLKPGGYFSCYEWMGTGEEPSEELRYWIELEELTYAFETLEQYGDRLRTAGFTEVSTIDASAWYRREARRECALIEGELYAKMVELLGQADADHFVKDWRAMVVVCNSGEMRQGYCRGRRSS